MRKINKADSLAMKKPELAAQWHPTRNGDLTPDQVTISSGRKVWWRCEQGHEWEAYISNRSAGRGCPYCSGLFLIPGKTDLGTTHPELASEWHPSRNGGLTPKDVSAGSRKKVWWKCSKCGREWQTSVAWRVQAPDCSMCSNKRVKNRTNILAVQNPGLAAQWHPSKNKGLTPNQVTFGSSRKVWWQCSEGHEWEATINSRHHGKGCPVCVLNKVIPGVNDLETLEPRLAAQWHPSRNGALKPSQVRATGSRKIWWQCSEGHEWESTISNRLLGNNCPICSGKKVLVGYNDLASQNPELASEWHPSKNENLTPTMVVTGSNKKVWWLGKCGHEWETTVAARSRGTGCPFCCSVRVLAGYNDLASQNPELASEWHPTKNGKLTPDMVASKSNKKVWWQCPEGHEWEATIAGRAMGNDCPICHKNQATAKLVLRKGSLKDTSPEVAAEWHSTKNGDLTPEQVTKGSGRKVWWRCSEGHEWQSTIASRSKGPGCPYCSKSRIATSLVERCGSLQDVNPVLAAQWHPSKNGGLTPAMVTPKSDKRVWWICEKGHEWEAMVSNRSRGRNCPVCAGRHRMPVRKECLSDDPGRKNSNTSPNFLSNDCLVSNSRNR